MALITARLAEAEQGDSLAVVEFEYNDASLRIINITTIQAGSQPAAIAVRDPASGITTPISNRTNGQSSVNVNNQALFLVEEMSDDGPSLRFPLEVGIIV